VLTFSPVVGIGTPPTPHPLASAPPPFGSGWRGTLAGGRVPNSDEGTYTVVSLYKYLLCGSEPAVGRGLEGERVEGEGVLPLHAHQVRHLLQGPEVRHVQANRLRQMLYKGTTVFGQFNGPGS
jgi:hypothetical protein